MRTNRSFRVWTKSIALIVLSLGGLTQFGMAKWKTVSADATPYISVPASALPPASAPATVTEPRPATSSTVASKPAPNVSSVISAPARPQSVAPQGVQIRALVTQAVSDNDLTTLTGNTHPYARAEFDQGAAPLDLPMNRMLMVLKRTPEQDAALSQLMDQQQDKSSPNYHKWLTPAEFGQQYGPADSDTQAVTSWLGSHGFQVARITNGRTVIEFSGTAAQVQDAFHTEIHKFVVNGEEHWANVSDPQIPSALVPIVHGLLSLHNFSKKSFHKIAGEFMRSKVTGEVTQVTSSEGAATNTLTPQFSEGSSTFFPLGPSDFATIYNVQGLWSGGIDGTGQTIAIVGQTNINLNDIAQFRSMFGLPVNPPIVILDGPDPGLLKNADEPEADLDVEWSGAVAKNATIKFVTAASTTTTGGVDLSALFIIDNNLAPVMSESYGECEYFLGNSGNVFYRLMWQQAAAQGITAMLSSGDSGSAVCDQDFLTSATFGLTVSGLSSTPYNVSVGGTDFDDLGVQSTFWNPTNTPGTNNSAKSYIPEVPWNNTCAQNGLTGCAGGVASNGRDTVGGSGGRSNCVTQTGTPSNNSACVGGVGYPKPSWQTGLGVPADGVRDVPDVSLLASNAFHGTGYVVCESDRITGASCDLNTPFQHFLIFGGTSASSPAFAGMMALVNQKVSSVSNPTPRQGNANPVLYALAAQTNARCDSSNPATITTTTCVFYDVTKGNNSVACIPNLAPSSCSSTTNGVPGVMIDPTSPSTEAFTTTAGYDLATGLGTVNAFNLANNWNSVTFTASSATLTLNGNTSALSITHGASVTMAGVVTPGTATGNVSLLSDAAVSSGIDGAPVAAGAYSKATKLLPGGTYNVHAHYAGDGVNGASDSATVHVTVTPENSFSGLFFVTFNSSGQPTLNPSPASGAYGAKAFLHVAITNSLNAFCNPNPEGEVQCATGTVSVTDNGSALAGAQALPLNSFGAVESPVIVLTGGVHTLQSNYSGDANYNSNFQTNTVTISKALTSGNLSVLSNNIALGASDTLTLNINSTSTTVANASQEPNGTVQFLVNGTPFGAPVTVTPGATLGQASGFAQLVTTTLPGGTDNISATYSGDGNYALSTSNTIPITVTGGSDLTVTKSHVGSFTQGQTGASYTITVANGGSAATTGTVTMVDTLPASMTATALVGSGWTCTVGTLTCTRTDALAASSSYPAITLTVTVSATAPTTVTNTATVSGGGETNTANDVANDATTISAASAGPDLTVTKTHSGSFTQGQVGATYTITVTNSGGTATAGTVTVVDTLPTGLTATAMSGTGWTCNFATRTCTRADALASLASYPAITLTVTIANNAAASLTNSVTVSGGGETNVANDTAADPTTVIPVADLTITKSHTGSFVQGQVGATYTITAANAGPGPTNGTVTVVDTLPTGLTATAISGTGWTCTLGTLTCTRNDALAAASSYPAITLTVTVANNAAASVTNNVAVSGGGELNTANDSASDITTVTLASDLTITKSHTGSFTQGQTGATYAITASNAGPGPTNGTVTVVDTLPAGLTATAETGTGWTCVLATLTCTRADALAISASYPPITLTVTVANNAAATLTNTAVISGGGELNTANDSASDITTIIPAADLTIAKSHVGSFTQGQVGATYSIIATNSGSGPTAGTVTVVDTLPTGLTATAIAGTGWTCTLGTLTCTRVDVLAAAGSYQAITVSVTVANNAPGTVTNTAVVSGGGELNTANDSASDPTTITQVADMTLTKSHVGNFIQGQVGAAYTIVATNIGTGPTTQSVAVSDIVPPTETATAITGTGWNCSLTVTPNCSRFDALAPGASYPPITLTVNISALAPATIANTATIIGGGEVVFTNDTSTDTATVLPPAAASLSVNTLAFTNQAVNTTSAAKSITVTNTGGAGLTFSAAPTITSTNAANFAVAAGTTCTNGATVAGGATCIINVTFTPPSAGSFGPATLTLTDNASPTTQTATLTGTGIDFSESAPTAPVTVTAGQTATYAITLTPGTGGFANLVTFSVSGLPAASTATFAPPSVTPGSSVATSTLSIATTARGAVPPSSQPRHWIVPQFALWSFALASILFGFILFGKTNRKRRLTPALFATVALLLAIGITGCAGGSGAPTGTPAGTSTITVTATSGALVHSTTVTLTVQ